MDPGGFCAHSGLSESWGLKAKTSALFEHGANILTGTKQTSPLPIKSKQLRGVPTDRSHSLSLACRWRATFVVCWIMVAGLLCPIQQLIPLGMLANWADQA